MPSSPSLCAHLSVLTHHLAEDEELRDEEPDGDRLHGVGEAESKRRRQRVGVAARFGSAWVGSSRVD